MNDLIGIHMEAVHPNGKNSKKPDDVGRSLSVDGGGPRTREQRR